MARAVVIAVIVEVDAVAAAAVANRDTEQYHRVSREKEEILYLLRKRGFRVTKQRELILDIVFEHECASCKEIYYQAIQRDPGIGMATVYRMVNTLESIGAISRKNMYRVACSTKGVCTVELDDDTICHLSGQKLNEVILAGLRACGEISEQNIRTLALLPVHEVG